MLSLLPLVTKLQIADKGAHIVPFRPNAVQLDYLHRLEGQLNTTGKIRTIVLKARQMGISTATEAVLFSLAFIFDNYKSVIFSHEKDSAEHILGITNLYWDTYPFKKLYTEKYISRNHLEWKESRSSIKIATAGGRGGGRSKTIHFLHASEVAFWPNNAGKIMLGLNQTIPEETGTGIVLESTANGIGNYFEEAWNEAVAGDSDYLPIFYGWWEFPEYRASRIGMSPKNLVDLDEEERELVKKYNVDLDQLTWRRWAIKNKTNNDIQEFHQEYPAFPEEAFISTGHNVFPLPKLRMVYARERGVSGMLIRNGQTVSFHYDPTGPLRVFKAPANVEWGQYYIGGDPTSTTRGDFACAQVVNRYTLEQVAVYRQRLDAGTFAEELFKLGLYYNTAPIGVEKEGPGSLTLGKLLGMNYPQVWRHQKIDRTPGKLTGDLYGWSTTAQTKHIAIGWLLKQVVDTDITIHDPATFKEMKNYVFEQGEYGPANPDEGHDDTVMALAIAVTCHMLDTPVQPYGAGAVILPVPREDEDTYDHVMVDQLPWEKFIEADNG